MVRIAKRTLLGISLVVAGAAINPGFTQPAPGTAAPKPGATGTVTVRAVGEPVVELLQEVTRQAGAERKAVPDLGERRVHLFAAGVPEPKVRRALAQVVGGLWVRIGQTEALRLEADGATERELRALLEAR